MVKQLLKLRYIYLVVVFFNVVNSIAFLVLGVYKSIKGYKAIIESLSRNEEWSNPGVLLAESLDTFLISFVFLIFAFGIWKIFIRDNTKDSDLPKWLDIKTMKDLKLLLWEAIVITLLVFTVTIIIERIDELSWNLLILPSVVFILTLGLVILRINPKKESEPIP